MAKRRIILFDQVLDPVNNSVVSCRLAGGQVVACAGRKMTRLPVLAHGRVRVVAELVDADGDPVEK